MSEPVLSRKRQGAQDAVDTLETFEAFEAFDKHGLPAFVRGVDAEALYFFWRFFVLERSRVRPSSSASVSRAPTACSRSSAPIGWDDPLFVRSGFLMQPTTAAKRRYDKVLSLMHVLEDLRRDDELDPRTLSRTVRTACYDNAFALCIASIFADFTARMPHVRLRATQADEHLFDYLREDLLDLVFFARQGLHPDIHSAALLTTPYVCLMRRGHPLSERAAALGPLEREDLEAFPQVLINAQPDRYRAPNSPGNGWFNPKNPDRIALVTLRHHFVWKRRTATRLCPRQRPNSHSTRGRTAILELSDAAPKLTVRLGWHERTHADPGSQLIRAQLLALIQKRFGRPAGE